MSIFSLNAADIANALQGGSPLSIINSVLHPSYAIRYSGTGGKVLDVDMVSISPSKSASVTTAPVEAGKYQSINKVQNPGRVRCQITISGITGFTGGIPDIFSLSTTSQSDTLNQIKLMLTSAEVYDIETPKEILSSYDLVDHSYTVSAQTGVSLLTVNLEFEEIMQDMEVTLYSTQSQKKPTNNGITKSGGGVASVPTDGSSNPSTLDSLKSSWANLKKATGQLTGMIEGDITQSFTSAFSTVSESASSIATSAVNKSTDLIKEISSSIT